MIPVVSHNKLPQAPSNQHLTTLLPHFSVQSIEELFPFNYAKSPLRPDHESRPIWVCPNLHLYFETYSPIYKQAYDFLIAISDPVSRPLFIHEYVITKYSLYAAASLGLSTHDIIYGLQRLCKNQVPDEVRQFITKHTEKCGKVKLVLKNQRYYIESMYFGVLQELLAHSDTIRLARCDYNIRTPEGRREHEVQQQRRQRDREAKEASERKKLALHNPFMSKAVLRAMMESDSDHDEGDSYRKRFPGGRGFNQGGDAAHNKRTALLHESVLDYNYDPETGFILERFVNEAPTLMLQGTGSIDKDGKRTLAKVDQRAAMGFVDDLGLEDDDDFDQLGFHPFDHDDDDRDGLMGASTGSKPQSRRVKVEDGMDTMADDKGSKSQQPAEKKKRQSSKMQESDDSTESDADDDRGDDDDDDDDGFDDDMNNTHIDDDEKEFVLIKNGKKVVKGNLSKKKMAEYEALRQRKREIHRERSKLRKTSMKGLQQLLKPQFLYSFEIHPDQVESVRKESNLVGYPMLEEYDFRHDTSMDEYMLAMALRPQAQIREYQEKALSKMFGSGRARSGIIVLPCGAGKTLVGITAMSTINRSTLIVVSTGVAAAQWREQIKLWTTLPENYIYLFTSGTKLEFKTKPKVIIATYSMLAFSGTRGVEAQKAIDVITGSEWGLVLLDEVHVAPADHFKQAITLTHSRCKLGLTATLVREDDKVASLIEMIGPKLYEASWLDLSRQGFIATVRCYEVWCPMDPDFFKVWLSSSHHLQRLLYVTNPNKYQALQMLVLLHVSRGDKVMIFCEDTIAIKLFSKRLGYPFILGETKANDRLTLLSNFSNSAHGDALFISKIGDNSIDLPDTNVIIQISSHYASRRQEAQRLGRILRQKSTKSGSSVDAHFYTLVSQDTDEMRYATKRQRFLVDQGYAYKVLKQADIQEQLAKLDLFKAGKNVLDFQSQADRAALLENLLQIFRNRQNLDAGIDVNSGMAPRNNIRAERPAAYQDSDASDSDSGGKLRTKKKQKVKK